MTTFRIAGKRIGRQRLQAVGDSLIEYVKPLRFDKLLLCSDFFCYLSMGVLYFDADSQLWLTTLGMALIVGVALVLSTAGWCTLCFSKRLVAPATCGSASKRTCLVRKWLCSLV